DVLGPPRWCARFEEDGAISADRHRTTIPKRLHCLPARLWRSRVSDPRPAWLRLAVLALASIALLSAGCVQSPEATTKKAEEVAEQYLKDGKANEAIIELKTALQVDKDFVPALHALGRAYSVKLWHADAARELSRAQTLAPDSQAIASDLGRALVELGAWK